MWSFFLRIIWERQDNDCLYSTQIQNTRLFIMEYTDRRLAGHDTSCDRKLPLDIWRDDLIWSEGYIYIYTVYKQALHLLTAMHNIRKLTNIRRLISNNSAWRQVCTPCLVMCRNNQRKFEIPLPFSKMEFWKNVLSYYASCPNS